MKVKHNRTVDGNDIIYFTSKEGKQVGYLQYKAYDASLYKVLLIYIYPEQRGCGFFKKMLHLFQKHYVRPNSPYARIEIDVKEDVARWGKLETLYRDFGFERYSRRDQICHMGESSYRMFTMEKYF